MQSFFKEVARRSAQFRARRPFSSRPGPASRGTGREATAGHNRNGSATSEREPVLTFSSSYMYPLRYAPSSRWQSLFGGQLPRPVPAVSSVLRQPCCCMPCCRFPGGCPFLQFLSAPSFLIPPRSWQGWLWITQPVPTFGPPTGGGVGSHPKAGGVSHSTVTPPEITSDQGQLSHLSCRRNLYSHGLPPH